MDINPVGRGDGVLVDLDQTEVEEPELLVDITDGNAQRVPINAESNAVDIDRHRWSEWMPTVSLVIPTRNEGSNLPHVLGRIPGWVTEILVVDGRSSDDTVAVAHRLVPDAVVIHQTGTGKGDAMRLGIEAATGDIIACIDADGSMDPAELHAFVGQLMAGADLVKGSRFAQGGGTVDMELHRKAGNWGLVWLTRILFGQRYSDLCYGYLAFWRRVADVVSPDVDGFDVEAQINARALRHNLKIAEVPSFEANRIYGVSHLNTFRDGWKVLRTLLAERFIRSRRTVGVR